MMHLRPRGFSELIDATFNVLRARFRPIATVGALMIIPGALLSLVMAMTMPTRAAGVPPTLPELGAKFWVMWAVLVPISTVVYTLGAIALIALASATYLGREADVGEAFAVARRRFWPVLGSMILKWIAVFAPFALVAVFIGGIAAAGGGAAVLGILMFLWFFVAPVLLLRWAVSTPVAALEQAGPGQSLGRSGKLTKGSKGRLFGLYLVFFIVFGAMYAVGATIGGLTGALFNNPLFANVLGNVMSMVLYPILAVLQTVIYYDLRIRNEGFDLEMMAGGLGSDAVLPAASTPARLPA
jgi:hypothetical protein